MKRRKQGRDTVGWLLLAGFVTATSVAIIPDLSVGLHLITEMLQEMP